MHGEHSRGVEVQLRGQRVLQRGRGRLRLLGQRVGGEVVTLVGSVSCLLPRHALIPIVHEIICNKEAAARIIHRRSEEDA